MALSTTSKLVCLLFLAAGCGTAHGASTEGAMAEHFEAIKQVERSSMGTGGEALASALSAAYERTGLSHLAQRERRALSDEEARLVFEIASRTSFYTQDPGHVRDMVLALDELERRDRALPAQIVSTYHALLSTRAFAQAAEFRASRPESDLRPSLTVIDQVASRRDPGRSELLVSDAGRTLVRREVAEEAEDQPRIYVVSHPLCAFSRRAADAIATDAALRSLMSGRSKWIAPQSHDVNFAAIAEWNAQRPEMQISIVYRRQEWPFITNWNTPVFYFVRGEKVVDTVVGWPSEGRKEQLLRAAEKLGVTTRQNSLR